MHYIATPEGLRRMPTLHEIERLTAALVAKPVSLPAPLPPMEAKP